VGFLLEIFKQSNTCLRSVMSAIDVAQQMSVYDTTLNILFEKDNPFYKDFYVGQYVAIGMIGLHFGSMAASCF